MSEADRARLDRLRTEWGRFLDSMALQGFQPALQEYAFSYWLIRHSGWTVEPPKETP